MELVRLRAQDSDIGYNGITVRSGKGYKDQLNETRRIHTDDLKNGFGEIYLPNAFI